jgi:hypothetical protein
MGIKGIVTTGDNHMNKAITQVYLAGGIKVREQYTDKDGTSSVVVTQFPRDVKLRKLEQMIPLRGSRCQHDYDCCGHWYAGLAKVRLTSKSVIVKQNWHMNV